MYLFYLVNVATVPDITSAIKEQVTLCCLIPIDEAKSHPESEYQV